MIEAILPNGVEVYIDKHIPCEKWERRPRLPKTKNKRIRRKWLKRYPQGLMVPDEKVYMFAGRFIMHPKTFEKLRKELSDDTDTKK